MNNVNNNLDLKFIKKHYGEQMAHLCRTLFPTLLETPGMLKDIMNNNFAPTKKLYRSLVEHELVERFKNFIYSMSDVNQISFDSSTDESPEDLLSKAGYTLFPECKTEEEIQAFKKYYKNEEEICTFNGGRLQTCRVWFAVKNNVADIKREYFLYPRREDEYGTSVISIQFTKGNQSTISIKNRYNHRVNNPDATFCNNLDNIIPGLTQAFVKKYKINLLKDYNQMFFIPGFAMGSDNKFHKCNISMYGNSYCENNVAILNGKAHKFDSGRFLLMDEYLVDLSLKSITTYDGFSNSFIDSIGRIKDIKLIRENNDQKKLIITPNKGEDIYIGINNSNQIISYENNNAKYIDEEFLVINEGVEKIVLKNAEYIGDKFLENAKELTEISLPNVKMFGNCCLTFCKKLKKLFLPNVKRIGNDFLFFGNEISELYAPNLKHIHDGFLTYNKKLTKLDLPSVKRIGKQFIFNNDSLEEINLPVVRQIGSSFLYNNKKLTKLYCPRINTVGYSFLHNHPEKEKFTEQLGKVYCDTYI